MSNNISLSSIFHATKGELASSLSGLLLPKDIRKVQECITNYLNKVCDEDNDFRQNLTQSEDYILQAALSMLNAQRDMVTALSKAPKIETIEKIEAEQPEEDSCEVSSESTPKETTPKSLVNKPVMATNAFLGSGGGALIGKFVLGGWGAVFGAIAGTALVLYLAQKKPADNNSSNRQLNKLSQTTIETKIVDVPVDTEVLMNVVAQLCDSLDNLIATFRAQIQRVVNKYESQTRPTIEIEHRSLLECIQSVIGYVECHQPEEANYEKKLKQRIEDLSEMLDSYGIEVIAYDGQNGRFFDEVESKQVNEPKMTVPAFVKGSKAVIKGKILIPIGK